MYLVRGGGRSDCRNTALCACTKSPWLVDGPFQDRILALAVVYKCRILSLSSWRTEADRTVTGVMNIFRLSPHQPWQSRPPSSQSFLPLRHNILFPLVNSWYPQHGRDITSPSLSTRHCPSLQRPHLTS